MKTWGFRELIECSGYALDPCIKCEELMLMFPPFKFIHVHHAVFIKGHMHPPHLESRKYIIVVFWLARVRFCCFAMEQ